MNSFINVTAAHVEGGSAGHYQLGKQIAQQCIDSLGSREEFPPKLFNLWVTPDFFPYATFLAGVNTVLRQSKLGHAALIGSTVAACVVGEKLLKSGAVLSCFASRYIDVKAAMREGIRQNEGDFEKPVKDLYRELGIFKTTKSAGGHKKRDKLKVKDDQYLMTYVPGYNNANNNKNYYAAEIVEQLSDQMLGQIAMFGGVSSGGNQGNIGERFLGYQFFGDRFSNNAIVAALITSDVPLGVTATNGLDLSKYQTSVELTPAQDSDPRELDFRLANDTAGPLSSEKFLFANTSKGEVVLRGQVDVEKSTIRVSRDVCENLSCKVVGDYCQEPTPFIEKRKESKKRLGVRGDGVAILRVSCLARLEKLEADRRTQSFLSSLNAKTNELVNITGYMDGEIGPDRLGSQVLLNLSVAEFCVYDTVHSRAWLTIQSGMKPSDQPKGKYTHDVALERGLKHVKNAKYVGGMISLVYEHGNATYIVAQKGFGKHWQSKVVPQTMRRLDGKDSLARIVKSGTPLFVPDNQSPSSMCDWELAREANIHSFYGTPLRDFGGKVCGVLQVDLGDRRSHDELSVYETIVLEKLARRIAAGLNRVATCCELDGIRTTQQWIRSSFQTPRHQIYRSFVKCFSEFLKKHELSFGMLIRLHDPAKQQLDLVAGQGYFYKFARRIRPEIDVADRCISATAFRNREIIVENDTSDPAFVKKYGDRCLVFQGGGTVYMQNPDCPLETIFAFPLIRPGDDVCVGAICFTSPTPWSVTQSKLSIFNDAVASLCQRIPFGIDQDESDHEYRNEWLYSPTSKDY